MSNNPKLKLQLNRTDKMLEFIGWILLCFIWALVIFNYQNLPESIPTHFDVLGKADGFGDKKSIFLTLIVATALFLGMSYLNRIPHTFNYLTPITEDNASRHYTVATRMIRCLKIIMLLTFSYIILKTIFNLAGTEFILDSLFLPLIIGSILVTVTYSILIFLKIDQ